MHFFAIAIAIAIKLSVTILICSPDPNIGAACSISIARNSVHRQPRFKENSTWQIQIPKFEVTTTRGLAITHEITRADKRTLCQFSDIERP
jgi:hypothetical protein